MTSSRLDLLLVDRGLARSRSAARDAILRGCVSVAGAPERRPGRMVDEAADVTVRDEAASYVSRAALKLLAGLDRFAYPVEGRAALDLGASTGGFTQALLERGASHVTAVEVGHGQMAEKLRADPRVTLLEGLNARDLRAEHLGGRAIGAVVCDVSFISLKLALPPALSLASPGAWGVFLVKPQFEAGREALDGSGIVRDTRVAEDAARNVAEWLSADQVWQVDGLIPSPIDGGDGNREFLLGARRV